MWRDKTVLAVSFAVFAGYTGTSMIVPVRVLYAQEEGASLAVIGAMATAFLVSNFIFQYPMGWLADRWGRKQLMIAGLIWQALVSLLYLTISDPALFIALRFVEGIASATLLPPARALIADRTPPEQRGQAYGIFNGFFNATWLLGPGIGSMLAVFGYHFVFIGAFLARLIAVVVVLLLIQNVAEKPVDASAPQPRISLRQLVALPLLGAYILAFCDYLWLGFDQTLFPIWMHDNLGGSVALIGFTYIVWGLPSTILSPFGGKLADRRRRSTLIFIFGLAQVPIYIIYGLLSVAWPMLVFAFLHSAIYAFLQPAVDAHVAASSVDEIRGRVQGAYTSVGLLGAFVGANGLDVLYGIDFRLPLFVMGAAYGVCVIIGGFLIRKSEERGLVAGGHNAVDVRQEVALGID